MRQIFILLGAVLALLAGPGWAGEADPEDARFEFLKGLAGTWVGTTPEGEQLFEFRLTAGGHAVEEREMIGTPMEMLTVYHMDGTDLVATHYCVLGNQPRATAAERVVDGALDFACAGKPGNSASHDDEHVHGWSMRLLDDGRLDYSAQLVKQGSVSEAPSFVLTRQSATARR